MADGLYTIRSNGCLITYSNGFLIPVNILYRYSIKLSLLRHALNTYNVLNPSFSGRCANERQ
jgi:hypothetical protein